MNNQAAFIFFGLVRTRWTKMDHAIGRSSLNR